MLSRFVASAAARLRGKVHVGTDALGNAYYSRPHPRIAGKEIREVLPAAGGSDPQSYDPSARPIEWAAWLNGREIAPMQAAVAAHEQVQARQEARRQAALAPPAAEVPAAPENEVLGRPGTGVFEPPPTKAFQPSAWTPGGGGAAARARGLATAAAAAAGGARGLSTARPPFRVLGLQQVAIGGVDKAPLSALWEGLLGVPKVGDYRSEKENVDEDILVLGRGAMHVELDLMQPIDPAKAPKVHVPTLNHIGIWVHPLDKAVAHLEAQGVRFTPGGIRKGAAGHDVCFIHPKGNEASPRGGEGVLIELVQAPPQVIATFDSLPPP